MKARCAPREAGRQFLEAGARRILSEGDAVDAQELVYGGRLPFNGIFHRAGDKIGLPQLHRMNERRCNKDIAAACSIPGCRAQKPITARHDLQKTAQDSFVIEALGPRRRVHDKGVWLLSAFRPFTGKPEFLKMTNDGGIEIVLLDGCPFAGVGYGLRPPH